MNGFAQTSVGTSNHKQQLRNCIITMTSRYQRYTIALLVSTITLAVVHATGVGRAMGQTCESDYDCSTGLDCMRTGILQKNCVPLKCAVKSVLSLKGFSLLQYAKDLAELMNQEVGGNPQSIFRKSIFPDWNMNYFQRDTPILERIMQVLEGHPPPIADIQRSFGECLGTTVAREALGRDWIPGAPNLQIYYGGNWALGLCGLYSGDAIIAQGSNDTRPMRILENCYGFALGYNLGANALLGLAYQSNTSQDLLKCARKVPLFDYPPFGLQIGMTIPEQIPTDMPQDMSDMPTFLFEFTAGADASVALPGYTQCSAQEF